MKNTPLLVIVFASITLGLSSCASVMNLHNNHSWQMGIDIVTTNSSPVKVVANGEECKTSLMFSSDYYYVTRAALTHPIRKMNLTITQNNVTRSVDIKCDRIKGLFWIEGLFVIVDYIKGTLIKYPAIEFDHLDKK